MDRSNWHPKTRAALERLSDEEISAMDREDLLQISGVGPKTVDAVLASCKPLPAAPGVGGVSFPPSAPGAAGRPFVHYPSASALFPSLLEASGGQSAYAAQQAAEVSAQLGAFESEIARASLDMLREFYRAGNVPGPQDARECVRLVRHLYSELISPTPSPFDAPPESPSSYEEEI